MANYFFAPFLLLVPLVTSSVISADSFAGEKKLATVVRLDRSRLFESQVH